MMKGFIFLLLLILIGVGCRPQAEVRVAVVPVPIQQSEYEIYRFVIDSLDNGARYEVVEVVDSTISI